MANTREKLQSASFKGISFLVESETKTGGKKTVTNEYVNSDKRFTEELGKLPPKFTINAIIHGDDSIQRRKIFEDKLDESGLGELVHPVYGSVQVKSTSYTVSSNQRSIGEFKFSINFETSEATITATPIIGSEASVTSGADAARDALDDGLEDRYIAPSLPSTLDAIAAKADEVYDKTFEALSGVTNTIQDKVSTFTKTVNGIRARIRTIVQQPVLMKAALKDLYATGLAIVDDPADLMDTWKDLTDFGFVKGTVSVSNTDTTTIGTNSANVDTNARIEEDIDRNLIDEHTRLTDFVNLIEGAAFRNFLTNQQIRGIRTTIDDNYRRLIENVEFGADGQTLTDDQLSKYNPLANDPTIRNKIQSLRNSVNRVLDQKSQIAFRIDTVDTPRTSIALTAYQYYGNLDNLDTLRDLNDDLNSSNIIGEMEVLSK
jgi:prophage DNA circulation protein